MEREVCCGKGSLLWKGKFAVKREVCCEKGNLLWIGKFSLSTHFSVFYTLYEIAITNWTITKETKFRQFDRV